VLVLVGVGVAVLGLVAVAVGVGVSSGGVHGFSGDAVLRGFGAAAAKSALLSSVSVHPAPARRSAVVVLSTGAGLNSEQLAVGP
jgi:hypothetical protein